MLSLDNTVFWTPIKESCGSNHLYTEDLWFCHPRAGCLVVPSLISCSASGGASETDDCEVILLQSERTELYFRSLWNYAKWLVISNFQIPGRNLNPWPRAEQKPRYCITVQESIFGLHLKICSPSWLGYCVFIVIQNGFSYLQRLSCRLSRPSHFKLCVH